jgi:mitogen-activated protein kinase 7
VGCILAELLGGRPFFKGRDYVDQLNQILHFLGTPNEETLSRIGSQRVFPIRVSSAKTEAQEYVRNLPFMPKIPFNHIFPNANPQGNSLFFICWFSLSESAIRITLFEDMLTVALDLLERLLGFDPAQRITVEEALEHPYLAIWHDPNDEPDAPSPFDFGFETVNDIATMKRIPPLLFLLPSLSCLPLRHSCWSNSRNDIRRSRPFQTPGPQPRTSRPNGHHHPRRRHHHHNNNNPIRSPEK